MRKLALTILTVSLIVGACRGAIERQPGCCPLDITSLRKAAHDSSTGDVVLPGAEHIMLPNGDIVLPNN